MHTPGPWKAEPYDPRSTMVTVAIIGSWRVGPETDVAGGNYRDTEFGSDETDARLIAAAPTMHAYITKRAEAGDAEAASILEAIDAGR